MIKLNLIGQVWLGLYRPATIKIQLNLKYRVGILETRREENTTLDSSVHRLPSVSRLKNSAFLFI